MRFVKPLLLAALVLPEVAAALPTTPIEVVESTVLSQRRRRRKKKKAPPPPPNEESTGNAFEGLDLTGEGENPPSPTEGDSATDEAATDEADPLSEFDDGTEPEDVATEEAEAPAVASSAPGPISKRAGLHAFVGADSAVAMRLPTSATGVGLGYFVGARYALNDDLEFDLSLGQHHLGTFGTVTLAWPAWRWLGQLAIDLGARYRVFSFGATPLFAGVSAKTLLFSAPRQEQGFYEGALPVLPGLEVGTRFATPFRPVDVSLRAHFWRLSGGFSPVLGLTTRMEVF